MPSKKKNNKILTQLESIPIPKKEKDFLLDWYSNPVTKNKLANTLSLYDNPDINTYGLNTKLMYNFPTNNIDDSNYKSDVDSMLNAAKNNIRNIRKVSPNNLNPVGLRGRFNPEDNTFFVTPEGKPVEEEIDIHEMTHPSNLGYVNDEVWGKGKNIWGNSKGEVEEIYPRINQLRFKGGFKPGQVITPEDINKVKSTSGYEDLKKGWGYEDDEILYMLNNMAQNNENKTTDIQSEFGGQLNMKKGNKKIKTIPYFDGGILGNVAGQASKLIPKDTTLGGAASGAMQGASMLSMLGGYGMLAGGLGGAVLGGIQGANAQDQNQVNNLSNGIQDRNQMLGFDDGGMLTYYNGGFEHNDSNPQNVNQGIPQGVTPNGQNNVTERNETKGKIDPIKDYVFSNNPDMKITKDMLEGTNLPKTLVGKTYAQASKFLDKDTKERPHDKISRESNAILLSQLKDLNENSIAQKDMSTFMKNGGNLILDNGGPMNVPNLLGNSRNFMTKNKLNAVQGFDPNNPMPNINYSNDPLLTAKASTTSPQNYANIQEVVNKLASEQGIDPSKLTMGQYNQILQNAMADPNLFAKIGNFGSDLGRGSVPWQKIQGRYAGNVGSKEMWATNPTLIKTVFPKKEYGQDFSDEEINQLQSAIKTDPNIKSKLTNGVVLEDNTPFGIDWLTAMSALRPADDIPDGGGGEGGDTPTGGSTPPPEWKDFPIEDKQRINTPPQEITTPGKEIPPNPNLWPEAGLLAALPYMGLKPNLADPTIMSTGYVKPQLVDEMTKRAGLNNAYSAGVGSMANYTGGNRGALMANLQGLSAGNMDATSNAFLQGNIANNQARQQADMFNIQNQTGVAGQNTNTLNRFELENKELINNINAKKADELSNTWGNYVENAYRRKDNKDTLNARLNTIRQYTGFGGGNMTPSTTTTIPGSSLELPSTNLNTPEMNYPTGVEQPQNIMLQNDRTQLSNRLNKAMGNTNLLFNPNSVQSTINSKIKKPAGFYCGGHLNTVRRSLK